ncbi:TonB C-terminal domain-containing protein [Ferrimonas balearica]|nr:TonB C-terminal domain-containing protein [Ferrimonas balearica]
MKRLAEALAFVALAVGLHLALAIRVPASGSESGGSGGEAMVTLQGAPEGMEEMIRAWETPPEAEVDPEAPEPVEPEPVEEIARPVIEETPPPSMPSLDVAEASTDTVSVPSFDTEVPPPPQPPEEVPQEVPEMQPEPEPTPAEEQPEVVEDEAPALAPVASLRPMTRPERAAPQVEAAPPPPPEPEPAPEPTPEARPADRTQQARQGGAGGVTQRAAGSGGASQAGNAGNAQVRTGNAQQEAKLQAVWGAKIRSRIERRKRFPNGMRGQTGRVVMRITVGRDGTILGASIARSSGQAAFDQAAVQAVQRAGRLPSAPNGLTQSSYTFTLPMDFS